MKQLWLLAFVSMIGVAHAAPEKGEVREIQLVARELKPKEPEWRMRVTRLSENGRPQEIVFDAESESDNQDTVEWIPVKRVLLDENERPLIEEDLIVTATGEVKRHGIAMQLYPSGAVAKIECYREGAVEGIVRKFHENGQVSQEGLFINGAPEGLQVAYHEDGSKAVECTYVNGVVEGDEIGYYANGQKSVQVPFIHGKKEGTRLEWYENGVLKVKMHFVDDLLQNEGKNPAVVGYDSQQALAMVQYYEKGVAVGVHSAYHPNGQERDHIPFKEGKVHGMTKIFSDRGELFAEGQFKEGVKVGKHWIKHPNGAMQFVAYYDDTGEMSAPLVEYNDKGVKIAEYLLKGDQLEGPFLRWYGEKQPQFERFYKAGNFEGEQREYYPSGILAKKYFFVNGSREGLCEEWYENGQLAFKSDFQNNEPFGECLQWYDNGKMKARRYFAAEGFDGIDEEWHENGVRSKEFHWKAGKQEGIARAWNNEGELVFDAHYHEGFPDSTVLFYYGKDRLKESIEIVAGQREGKSVEYHPNGVMKVKCFYEQNKPEGLVQGWFEDGHIAFVRFFKGGVPIGEQKEYFPYEQLDHTKQEDQIARISYYNGAGQLHGEQLSFYPTGLMQSTVSYDNGLLHGKRAVWTPDGELSEEAHYQNNKLEGRFFQKNQQGRMTVAHYKNNRKDGPYELYHPIHPQYGEVKAIEGAYLKGKLEGQFIEYDITGNKIASYSCHAGEREGVAEIFDGKGVLAMKISFKQSKRDGDTIQYFPGGVRIAKVTPYKADQIEGEERSYFPSGHLASTQQYSAGKLNGLSQSFNEEGKLIFEAEYLFGQKEGKFNKYYDNGKPRLLQSFHNDQLVGVKQAFDQQGKLIVR